MLVWIKQNLLSIVIFLPLAGVLAIALLPRAREAASKYIAISLSLVNLLVGVAVYIKAHGSGEFEMVHQIPWIPSLGVYYRVGVDGASALMVLLTTIIMVVALLASWREITKRLRLFYGLMLVISTGITGVFASIDMFLFFVFWDAALIPMCFVIGIWGSGDRIRVAMKFLIFTAAGSLAMLVAILYAAGAVGSFNLMDWYAHDFAISVQLWLFTGFALAFAIKVPLIGLHTWMPDAHTEAPTAGSIVLAGVMLKLGAYGFFRLAVPLFPAATSVASPVILTLAVAGVVLGALLAMVQEDLKRLIAYSSISHMGLVVLGIFSLERYAATGALFQMASHGLIVAGLFAMAGFFHERRGTRLIADYGGSSASLPMMTIVFITLVLGAIGLPGLSGFVGEFMILLGSFQTRTEFSAISVAGVVVTACYLIWIVQRIFFGKLEDEEERKIPDMRAREYLCVLPIIVIILVTGIWPKDILGRVYRSADAFVALARRGQMFVPLSASKLERRKGEDADIAR
jgi:NADH-quinone oxidoreductase subunit M